MNHDEIVALLEIWFFSRQIMQFAPVGSRITCNPPPSDTDEDWLVLLKDAAAVQEATYRLVKDEGFVVDSYTKYLTSTWTSIRSGDINLIFLSDKDEYDDFLKARNVCKALNIMDKAQRKLVHDIIMYGEGVVQ